jgi:hypothetical protein
VSGGEEGKEFRPDVGVDISINHLQLIDAIDGMSG